MPLTKIIHQTWKTDTVPEELFPFEWVHSWNMVYPDWAYKLWTDADNRQFMSSFYPNFLWLYDYYKTGIERADLIRYFILHQHGGLYADLDCIALKPLSLSGTTIMLSVEPPHYGEYFGLMGDFISNTLMYSEPGHPFWEFVFEKAIAMKDGNGPIYTTGPMMLSCAYEEYLEMKNPALPLLRGNLYPWCKNKKKKISEMVFNNEYTEESLVIHANTSVWLGTPPNEVRGV